MLDKPDPTYKPKAVVADDWCPYRKNGYCSEDGHPCREGEECRIYGKDE